MNTMTPERWQQLMQTYDVLHGATAGSHVEHPWYHAHRDPGGTMIYIPDENATGDASGWVINMASASAPAPDLPFVAEAE